MSKPYNPFEKEISPNEYEAYNDGYTTAIRDAISIVRDFDGFEGEFDVDGLCQTILTRCLWFNGRSYS